MDQLYYQDVYLKEWTARILSVEKIERGGNDFFAAELDRTGFYPEGGGQSGDRGFLGQVEILDTIKKDNHILHLSLENPGTGEVNCTLDWKHRFDYMQQHTGQHILSAVLKQQFDINTVSVYQGEDYTSVETDSSEITEEQLKQLNDAANSIILENRAVKIKNADSQKLSDYPLRRPTSRSGIIRLVEIDGYDLAACGGVHCSSTAEVRLIHVYAAEKVRGCCKILAKIGERALKDYQQKTESAAFISKALSVPVEELVSGFIRYAEEMSELKSSISDLQISLADSFMKQLSSVKSGQLRLYSACFSDEPKKVMTELAKKLIAEDDTVFFLANTVDKKVQWSLGSSPDINLPFADIKDKLFKLLEAKGGGKSPLWQGVAGSTRDFDAFVEYLSDKVSEIRG